MTKWELKYFALQIKLGLGGIIPGIDPIKALGKKGDGGKSPEDELAEMAAQGWELVSVTPIVNSANPYTTHLLFTLKRPLE